MKVTPRQYAVLSNMRLGYTLCESTTSMGGYSQYYLQYGQSGRGGETRNVHASTVSGLEKKKLIKRIYGFPVATYQLTKLADRIEK